ncbi:hypothetical protein V8E53_009721 [Lactarius tabidus]
MVQRIHQALPPPGGDHNSGSDTTRNDSGDDAAITELGRPAVRDIEEGADLNVEPFAFKPLQLASLVDPKSLENFENLGGALGLIRGLGTSRRHGLSTNPARHLDAVTPYGMQITPPSPADEATIEDRQRVYGQNILPQHPSKSLLRLMWLAIQDKVLVLLLVAAVVSLALSPFQDFGTTRPKEEHPVCWVNGVAIIATIFIDVAVGSLNDWQKEKQFKSLNAKKGDHLVKVIRDGREQQIHLHQVVVGDVMLLEPGDIIPCDGVFLSGHSVLCDESSATGESDAIKKLSYEECIAIRDKRLMELDADTSSGSGESRSGLELLGHADCFIVSGSKVLDGVGSFVVTSVGTKSFNGRIMMALSDDWENENTPLQVKLNDLANAITKIGSVAGGLLFVSLLVRYFLESGTANIQRTPRELGWAFVGILNMSVALAVVALPQGLPLAITLVLAFATRQMFKENLLVGAVGSCEVMANATMICTDKTGTLTQNEMTVISGSVGVHAKFVRKLEENREWASSDDRSDPNTKDLVDLANLNAVLHPVKDLLNAAIAINSTAFEDVDPKSGAPVWIGSKTESALLGFAKELGWPNYKDIRDSADIVQMIPFNSDRKSMGCVVRLPSGGHRLFVKGASEILARKCTRHVVVSDTTTSANEVDTAPIGEREEGHITRTITSYASQPLHTIALCYRDFPSWPPKGARLLDKDEVNYDDLITDLTLISIIGIENPLRPGVREAVANCAKAGVRVKMCSGDNVLSAKSIAQQCGIYTPGGIVMEGPHFRTLPPDVIKAIVPRLQVLARSSPEDKRILVETLKGLGDVVGVTGDDANDGPTLKTAHVGFSMGIAGTEVAKEASDISLMDDNFSSIVKAIMWGRCVNDSVRKFLQFQISGNVTAVVTTFVWALASSSEGSVLSAVQLLWANLIMDTFAALALATDPASPALFHRKPDKKADPLFTINMIKQILGQAIYQITMILIFHFLGPQILGFHHTDQFIVETHHNVSVRTLVFNAFVFAQIFNSFNCRRLDRKLNVFEGMTKNWYFMAITAIEVAVQVLICFDGGSAFDVTRIGAREWVISLVLGFLSLPLGALIRLIPNEPCERAFKKLQLLPTHELLPTTHPDAEPGFSSAIDHVRDNLAALRHRRGSIRGKSLMRQRRAFPHPDGAHSWLAMVPYPDASHTAAPDWPWRARGSRSNPRFDPSMPSATLWENVFEVHPETPPDDPVYGLLGMTPPRPVTPAMCAS